MAGALRRHPHAGPGGRADHLGYLGRGAGEGDRGGALVDGEVPGDAGRVVPGVAGEVEGGLRGQGPQVEVDGHGWISFEFVV